MPKLLDFFRAKFTADSEVTAYVELGRALRERVLDDDPAYTADDFGPFELTDGTKRTDILPDPDQLYAKHGFLDDSICDDMAANVPDYGALVEGDIDVAMSLVGAFIAGDDQDDESNAARDECEAAWNAIPDRHLVERHLCRANERGFMGAKNIFGVQQFASARDYIAPIALIDKPRKVFGFDYDQTPYFKALGKADKPRRVDDYAVIFQRCGSVNTGYGVGYAQKAYPTVWAIRETMLGHMALVERFGYMPVEMHYPSKWPRWRVQAEYNKVVSFWKNVLPVPDGALTDGVSIKAFPTEAAYANAQASGQQRLAFVDRQVMGLARLIRGSMLSSSNQAEGSFARDDVADSAQLWKAPTLASARESMVNRGFIEPCVLVNRPTLERHKWPRYVVDAKFGEDLRLFIELCEFAANHGIAVSQVVWSERTGIPLAQEGDVAIESAAPALTPALPDPVEESVRRFSEPWITITTPRGLRRVRPDDPVMTRHGVVRAAKLTPGMSIVDPDEVRKVARLRAL